MCVRVVPFDICEENEEDMDELLDSTNSQGEKNYGYVAGVPKMDLTRTSNGLNGHINLVRDCF